MDRSRRWALLIAGALALACAPEWHDDPAAVLAPRIIAVEVDPPEALPGAAVSFTAITATPQGPAAWPVAWAFCRTPKSLDENGAVDPACVSDALAPAGQGTMLHAALPTDGCRLFGPETPPQTGRTPPRPRDADGTGGYYQPVVATGLGTPAITAARITCALATAPLEVAAEYARDYVPNRNPQFEALEARVDGQPVPFESLPLRPIELGSRWAPETAEAFLAFDPATQLLVQRREALRISWFVTAGAITHAHGGRAEDDPRTDVTTRWRPDDLGPGAVVHLWAVMRDSRGGVAVATRRMVIAGP